MTNAQLVSVDYEENIALVSFDRPETLNALNSEMLQKLSKVLDEIEARGDIFAVVFTGTGKAFISGADISEMENLRGEAVRDFSRRGRDTFRRIEQWHIPSIAAINGYAFGGGLEMALAKSVRLASTKAKMGFPEVGLGVIPGFSGTQRLPRIVGRSQALYMMLTGDTIDAQKALEFGLVTEVLEPEDLLVRVQALAKLIANKSVYAVQSLLLAVNLGSEIPMDAALEIETGLMATGFGTLDQIEGMAAFREKRKPKFER